MFHESAGDIILLGFALCITPSKMLIGTCFQRFTLRGFPSGHVFDPLCDSGKALSCCTIQELVGCSVTLNWRILGVDRVR